MSNPNMMHDSDSSTEAVTGSRMSVDEVVQRLHVGRQLVYTMLEAGILPGIKIGRRWIITRRAYEQWERTCGMPCDAGLRTTQEVTVS